MCGNPFKAPKMPAVESTPPPAVETSDPAISDARERARRRMLAAGGRNSTILTRGAGGMMNGAGGKTLLGS